RAYPAADAALLRRDHPIAHGVVRVDLPAEGLPVEALERSRVRPAHLEPADRIRHRPPLPRHGPSRRGPGARAPQCPARRPAFCQRLIAWAACGGPVTARGCEMTTPEGAARTVIVTVDDDPGVSRAVARDLRRRYGEQHRIVRAESGDAALEALREMKLRGDEVAVIVADYRMPGMNGIEFLERPMDFYPTARRVLLTAYADTGAAIDAINVVDLDHYLLKPWDPPEEKLYPVLDELLSKWHEEDRHPVHVTKVVGHRWSARSSEVREFLARNQIAYRWFESEAPDGPRLMQAAGAGGVRLP